MSDIEILFSSNASTVIPQIDGMNKSVSLGETIAQKFTRAGKSVGEMLHEVGRSAGHAGHELGRAFGKGGGVGIAIAALLALRVAVEVADHFLDRSKEHAKAAGESYLKMAQNVKQANDIMGKAGEKTAATQGQTMLKLIGAGGGGLALANSLSAKYGVPPEEMQKATAAAQKKFGSMAPTALEAAARAFAAGGPDVSEGIGHMSKGLLAKGSDAAASKILGGDIASAEKNIGASEAGSNIGKIRGIQSQTAISGQDMLGQGVRSAASDFSAAIHPLASIMTEQTLKQNEELEVLKGIRDQMGVIATIYDHVRHPFANAGAKYSDAASDMGAAQ